jgi:hypothetical protein
MGQMGHSSTGTPRRDRVLSVRLFEGRMKRAAWQSLFGATSDNGQCSCPKHTFG